MIRNIGHNPTEQIACRRRTPLYRLRELLTGWETSRFVPKVETNLLP
jgi:hypothetical protein